MLCAWCCLCCTEPEGGNVVLFVDQSAVSRQVLRFINEVLNRHSSADPKMFSTPHSIGHVSCYVGLYTWLLFHLRVTMHSNMFATMGPGMVSPHSHHVCQSDCLTKAVPVVSGRSCPSAVSVLPSAPSTPQRCTPGTGTR